MSKDKAQRNKVNFDLLLERLDRLIVTLSIINGGDDNAKKKDGD
jgi:hypothetical protein